MRILFILLCLSLGLAQQPEFTVNSFNLALGEALEVTAKNLSSNSRYALTLSSPDGALLRENPRTDATGSLTFQRVLQDEGEWSVRLKGSDIDTQLFVTVSANPLSTTESEITQNPLSQNEAQPTVTESGTATETQTESQITPESTMQQATPPATESDTLESTTQTTPTDNTQSTTDNQSEPNEETSQSQMTEEAPLETGSSTEIESSQSVTEEPASEMSQTTAEVETSQPLTTTEEPESSQTPDATTPTDTTQTSPLSVTLENNALRAPGWSLDFPEESGQTQGLIERNNAVYTGHGNSLLKIDSSGKVEQRWLLSGQIKDIKFAGKNLEIVSDIGNGLSESFTLADDQLVETVRFSNQSDVFSWLKNEAKVSNPVEHLEQDATNPWLYVAAAKVVGNSADARVNFEQAVEKASTFYDLAGISRELVVSGNTDLADHAMDKALKDFASRGYDPRLLSNTALHESYNFPLQPLKEAVREQNMEQAAFWAKWLRYFSSSNVPDVQKTLSSYADLLASKGERTEANLWRSYARAGRQTGIGNLLDMVMTSIGRLGWYGVISLLIGLLGLALTLLFKYWEPHSLLTRRRQVAQKSTAPWARLWAVRHYSFTEKLFVVLLLAAIMVLAALANWNDKGKEVTRLEAFNVGTLANGLASNTLDSLPDNARSDFIRGYAAQVSGDNAQAKTYYEQAGNFGPAINNLAVLSGDESLYKRALELSPGLAEARVNQGQQTGQIPFAEYASPVLAVPAQTDVQTAIADSWQTAIAKVFTNPWLGVQNVRPNGVAPWLWVILMSLFLLLSLVSLIWLFIPRPKISRNAPRNVLYHLMSLLIPGSGLADEMWGILLLVPWAFIGLDVLSKIFKWNLDLGLSFNWGLIALGAIYLINTIAFFVELASYQKRMKQLKQTNPDLAREFGLRVRA